MPVIARHRLTGEIAGGMMRNIYDFMYYGALWWENKEAAESLFGEGLAASGYEDTTGWDLIEVDDSRLKLMNVKLNNDAERRLYMERDGTLTVRKSKS